MKTSFPKSEHCCLYYRRYRYTFEEGGFYQSLKKKAKKILMEDSAGEEWKSKYVVENDQLRKELNKIYFED